MRALPQKPGVRIAVVAGGAILMFGCALAAYGASWLYYEIWPSYAPGRGWMIVPFAPLTALAILITGTYWTYRLRASVAESVGALLVVELIAGVIIAVVTGDLFGIITFTFLAVVSVGFAPSWLLAAGIGRAMRGRRDG